MYDIMRKYYNTVTYSILIYVLIATSVYSKVTCCDQRQLILPLCISSCGIIHTDTWN